MNIRSLDKDRSSSADPCLCNGCGVCMLSCPVWQQQHTKALTNCGRTRAAIGGAPAEELADSAKACILCGSCESICPMGISTQEATIALRKDLAARGLLPIPSPLASRNTARVKAAGELLVAGKALLDVPIIAASAARILGKDVALFPDDGHDLASIFEAGGRPDELRLQAFIEPLLSCSRVVVSDGLQFNLLRAILPERIVVEPLGRALLANPRVRAGIRSSDFYVIESRAYNATRREAAALYNQLRLEIGCSMNLDLLRVAIPTGAASYQHQAGLPSGVSVEAQVAWMLEGSSPGRIVVEHLADAWAFREYTSLPVVHLAEVAAP